MSGDIGDILEAFEGPRTLRYFLVLLVIAVCVVVIGALLSNLYGIHWVEYIGLALANNPEGLLNLAGILALMALAITVVPIVLKHVD